MALKKAGIFTRAFYIAGLPGETVSSANKTLELALNTNADNITLSPFTVTDRSKIAQEPDKYQVNLLADGSFRHSTMTQKQIFQLHDEMQTKLILSKDDSILHGIVADFLNLALPTRQSVSDTRSFVIPLLKEYEKSLVKSSIGKNGNHVDATRNRV